MNQGQRLRSTPKTIALVGNYLPRKCGIATFTTDLLQALKAEAPRAECWAVVMNDTPRGHAYPAEVRFEVGCRNAADYRLAADFLNINRFEVVSLQHEFGIFGGPHGRHILEMLRQLRMPIVTTLHTVLREPDAGQRAVLVEVGRMSGRIVVMSHTAADILWASYGVARDKILVIPHGVPDLPFVDPSYYKDQFGLEGRTVILTFGLVSPGKGIEYMIDALPRIVEAHPDVTYVVLGATHPHVKRDQGEAYRHSLQRRARERGVEKCIVFHNRFVEPKELGEFLGAADIYVTPYLDREQIVSGTLAYALGAGKAVVSTPYQYAQEMLADDRGRLVPFRDSRALADRIIELLDRDVERNVMRKRAYNHCRGMTWRAVARRYLEAFVDVKEERECRPRPAFRTRTLEDEPLEVPRIRLDHLELLTDDVGILQHARFIVPDRVHGYCTDDNARALIAVMLARELEPENPAYARLACRYLAFLNHAFNPACGRFRNFMTYDRRWSEGVGSEDAHGRAIWGLGTAVAFSPLESLTGLALNLFERSLPGLLELRSSRAWAFGLAGIHAYLHRFEGDSEVRRARDTLAGRLLERFSANASDDWPWPEGMLAYANGRIPHALLQSGRAMQCQEMIDAGLRALAWLLRVQSGPGGHFVPIGNHGWFERNGPRARFDQQPIEAQNMIDACLEAVQVTGDERWFEASRRCFEWFLGRNDLQIPLYDYRTGGCRDGLTADGANQNQGAESTLAWLLSAASMQLRGAAPPVEAKAMVPIGGPVGGKL